MGWTKTANDHPFLVEKTFLRFFHDRRKFLFLKKEHWVLIPLSDKNYFVIKPSLYYKNDKSVEKEFWLK